MRWLWWLLLALPTVQAASVSGAFDSVDAHIQGDVHGQVEAAAFVIHPLLAPAAGPIELRVEGVLHHLRTRDAVVAVAGQPAILHAPGPEELVESTAIEGALVVHPSRDTHLRVLAHDMSGSITAPFDASASRWSPGPTSMASTDDPRGAWHEAFARPAWPLGQGIQVVGLPTEMSFEETHYIYIYGAHVQADSGAWHTGTEATPVSPGGVETTASSHDYLVIESRRSWISWGAPPAALVREAIFDVHGQARFLKADGTLLLDGHETPHNRQLVILNGTFGMQMTAYGGHQQWTIDGVADAVAIDTRPIIAPPSALGVSGVALLGGLLALLAWIILGRNAALEHETRMALFQHIWDEPAITRMELTRRVGIKRSAARYHLSRLTADQLVTELRAGKNQAYVLNAVIDLHQLNGDSDVQTALMVLGDKTRRAILRAAQEGVNHAAFAAQYPISAPGFTLQCQVLADVGLLQRESRGRGVIWRSRITLDEIRNRLISEFARKRGHIAADTGQHRDESTARASEDFV